MTNHPAREPSVWVDLGESAIEPSEILAKVADVGAGASVLFVGAVRDQTDGRAVAGLFYEAHRPMALAKLEELCRAAAQRHSLIRVAAVHRLGQLELGEVAVAVAVSAPHRAEAFRAAEELMNAIKADAPIWKREHWADSGDGPAAEWRHPSS